MSKPEALVDRMKLLLSTGNGADVHFLVEEGDKKERLPVHKAILSAASDVFEAMFRFDTTNTKVENGLAVVVITDVEVEAFRTMLNCIYADDLMGLNGDNLFAVLYAAKKYNIVRLINACLAFPIPKLPNVFFAFAQARFLEENDFARRCMEFIEQNADTLFQSDGFLLIDDNLLGEILGRERLAIEEEIVIWNAALRWADAQCAQNGIDCSAENRRQMLGPALYKIRFPRMPKEVFANAIVPTGVLASGELISILLYHAHPGLDMPELYPLQFPIHRAAYALRGRLTLVMNKLVDLTRPSGESREHIHHFNDTVFLRGLPWTIYSVLLIRQCLPRKRLDFFLCCNVESKVQTWSCTCTVTRRIASRKAGKADYVDEGKIGVISSPAKSERFHHFMPFDFSKEKNSEWYKAEDEAVTLAFDVITP